MSLIESAFKGSPQRDHLSDQRMVGVITGRKKAKELLYQVLSRSTNPQTGLPYTEAELEDIFHLNQEANKRKLPNRKGSHQPLPEVLSDELPQNEKDFFLGLALGGYSINHLKWGRGNGSIVIKTDARRERTRELLGKTIGRWGEVHENRYTLKIYLASPNFDFLLDPEFDRRLFNSKSRFASFVLGVLATRLSDREGRFSLSNEVLLRRIHRRFFSHFGFSMGFLAVEDRRNKSKDGDTTNRRVPVILVKNSDQVFDALTHVREATPLPFLSDLTRLSKAPA